MNIKKFFGLRTNILIIFLVLSLIAIKPTPWIEGVQIRSVEKGSIEEEIGLATGQLIKSINDKEIKTLYDYKTIIEQESKIEPVNVKIKTDTAEVSYEITNYIGFDVENLTVIKSNISEIQEGMKIEAINDIAINSTEDYYNNLFKIIPTKKLTIITNTGEYAFLTSGKPKIIIGEATKTNIKKGLDLEGGTRVILEPSGNVTEEQMMNLKDTVDSRLNVYGLSDITTRIARDKPALLGGKPKFLIVDVAGISEDEARQLIGQQGKFEAKIGNDLVFVGGRGDIPYVCRRDGSCAYIRTCDQVANEQWNCRFEFVIHLSASAAKRHSDVTGNLEINTTVGNERYLSKTLDFYLDDKKVDSLRIDADLKGREVTEVVVSGSGSGRSEEDAINDAQLNMDRLQTILITGSLPLKLNIVKLDTISPLLGQRFIKNVFLTGFLAIVAVALVIYVRYRKIKITIPIIITCLSEAFITLGFAAISRWNLDLAAIAGIIAAVGTGVDDQIVITDEALRGEVEHFNTKQKIKNAFSIILISYATLFAAMIPLGWAGAGLIKGFAFTTIVGITVGVLVTRPAFATWVGHLTE